MLNRDDRDDHVHDHTSRGGAAGTESRDRIQGPRLVADQHGVPEEYSVPLLNAPTINETAVFFCKCHTFVARIIFGPDSGGIRAAWGMVGRLDPS